MADILYCILQFFDRELALFPGKIVYFPEKSDFLQEGKKAVHCFAVSYET
jgi:hypothetical protein